MTIGERLKAIRVTQGFTQGEFSELLGVTRRTYQNYELDINDPPVSVFSKISKIFQIDPAWLLNETSNMTPDRPESGDQIYVPRYDTKAPEGYGKDEHCKVFPQIVEMIPVLKEHAGSLRQDKLRALCVECDSMKPKYSGGSIVFFLECYVPRMDGDFVVNRNGELIVKTVQFLHDGGFNLLSVDPLFPPQFITAENPGAVLLVGKVVGRLDWFA